MLVNINRVYIGDGDGGGIGAYYVYSDRKIASNVHIPDYLVRQSTNLLWYLQR